MLAILGLIAGICGLVGWIWIIVIAFQNGDTGWGVVSIICGLAALIYGVQHADEAKVPLILLLIGIVGNVATRLMLSNA